MSKIILIRHGQSEYNIRLTEHLDSALTEEGVSQVEKTARNVKKIISKWNYKPHDLLCWTSPYLRCLQTADIIQQETGLHFHVDHVWLRETMLTYKKVEIPCRKKKYPQFSWSFGVAKIWPFFTESTEEYTRRIKSCHRQIERSPFFIGISHGTPITDLISLFNGSFTEPNIDKYVENASINLVETN